MKKKAKRIKSETKKYKFIVKEADPITEIRWIMCQHCNKPVYGIRCMERAVLPNKQIITEWRYHDKGKKRKVKMKHSLPIKA